MKNKEPSNQSFFGIIPDGANNNLNYYLFHGIMYLYRGGDRLDLIIPDIVATSTEINSNEKLLYAYLKNSNKGKEYVSMTNREISDGFPLKPATISQSISNLERKGFIKRVIVRSEKNQVMERQIFTLV